MENTRRVKQLLIGTSVAVALCFLPESTLTGAKKALEAMAIVQLCHEVFKRQNEGGH